MNLKSQINTDLKNAMLAGDKPLTTTLRGLKSAILYAEVAAGKREEGLEDDQVVSLLRKEAKKRQESAALYTQGGDAEKAHAELAEFEIIEAYLPQPMTDQALEQLVDRAVKEIGELSPASMGRVIARVKELAEGGADGGRIAGVVKQRLQA